MTVCQCCLCEEEMAQYQLITDVPTEWKQAIYCCDCMEQIRSNTWSIAKSNLLGVDCLAAFRSIQQNGLPLTLVEHDVVCNKKSVPVKHLKYGEHIRNADIGADLNETQRNQLLADLKTLDPKDVAPEDIKAIAKKYWFNDTNE